MTRALLIHNPDAGDSEYPAAKLLRLLADAGYAATYQSSLLQDVACPLAEEWELVVVAGGDGVANWALRACAGRESRFAILPLGNANNIATCLGHLGSPQELVRRWDVTRHRPFYLGQVRGPWGASRFAESFGVGVLAEAFARNAAQASWSPDIAERRRRFDDILLRTLHELPPQRMTVIVDGRPHDGEYLWLEVSRVGLVAANLPVIEKPDPSQPELHLALLPARQRETALSALERREAGDDCGLGLVELRGGEISIAWTELRAHLDGDMLPFRASPGQAQLAHFRAHAAPVRVLTLR